MNRREFVAMAPAFPVAAVTATLTLKEDGKEPLELDVSVLKLQPGDTLVLTSERPISQDSAARIIALVEHRFAGVKAAVFSDGIKLDGVLRGPA